MFRSWLGSHSSTNYRLDAITRKMKRKRAAVVRKQDSARKQRASKGIRKPVVVIPGTSGQLAYDPKTKSRTRLNTVYVRRHGAVDDCASSMRLRPAVDTVYQDPTETLAEMVDAEEQRTKEHPFHPFS